MEWCSIDDSKEFAFVWFSIDATYILQNLTDKRKQCDSKYVWLCWGTLTCQYIGGW